jgi:tryptophanyl-tRNA synthetase
VSGQREPTLGGRLPRILSGIQPTADSFHLGNLLGAVRQWPQLAAGREAFYFVADLHALTVDTDPVVLRDRTRRCAAQLIAAGCEPDVCTLFLQSEVPEHTELTWILSCLTGYGEASRMIQFKDKAARAGADATNVGLFTYPVLQAADILLYDADQVPVGEDQRQHLELTRNLAQRFNHRFGPTLRMPEPHIVPAVARIADLADPTAKMSKSGSSPAGLLNVLDEPKVNAKKIRSAVTDTGTEVRADEAAKPGITNLLRIHSALSGRPVESIEAEFAGRGYGDFKAAVAQEVLDAFAPIRERTLELLAKPALLDEALEAGAVRAREVAGATLAAVRDRVGLPAARRTEPGT